MGRKTLEKQRGSRSIEAAFNKAGGTQTQESRPPQPAAPPLSQHKLQQERYRSRSRSRDRTRDRSRNSSSSRSVDSVEGGIAPIPTTPLKGSHMAIVQHITAQMHAALQAQSKQLSADFRRDMKVLCDRTAALEIQGEELQNGLEEAVADIRTLQEENETLQSKLEDMENRSRRSNLRFRGIPESILDVADFTLRLCQDLTPDLPLERLELERAHRALTRKNPSGPPRDVVVKFLYFKSKEAVLAASRTRARANQLSFSGHPYQVFADLAPSTIQKRREMKPTIALLLQNGITYKWGFPFRLIFQFRGKYHAVTSSTQAQTLLRSLNLLPPDPDLHPKTNSSSPSASKRPRSPIDRSNQDTPVSPDGKQAHRQDP